MPDPVHPGDHSPGRAATPDGSAACQSYAAGHRVHWMQALRTSNKPEAIAASWHGDLIGLDGDALTVAHQDGAVTRFRNHDVPRLRAVAQTLPVGVTVNVQFAVLRIGSYVFSVHQDGEPWSPCTAASPDASS